MLNSPATEPWTDLLYDAGVEPNIIAALVLLKATERGMQDHSPIKTCRLCGVGIDDKRSTTIFCSNKCQKKASRDRCVRRRKPDGPYNPITDERIIEAARLRFDEGRSWVEVASLVGCSYDAIRQAAKRYRATGLSPGEREREACSEADDEAWLKARGFRDPDLPERARDHVEHSWGASPLGAL